MSLGTVGADRRIVVTAHRRRRAAAVAAAAAARPDTPDAWACRDSGLVLLGDAAVDIERRVGEAPEVLFEREARQRRVRRASRKLGARRALPLRQPLRSVLRGRFLRCEQVAGAVALRRLLASGEAWEWMLVESKTRGRLIWGAIPTRLGNSTC